MRRVSTQMVTGATTVLKIDRNLQGGLGGPVGALLEPALVAFQVLVEVVALDQAADWATALAGVLDIDGQPVLGQVDPRP